MWNPVYKRIIYICHVMELYTLRAELIEKIDHTFSQWLVIDDINQWELLCPYMLRRLSTICQYAACKKELSVPWCSVHNSVLCMVCRTDGVIQIICAIGRQIHTHSDTRKIQKTVCRTGPYFFAKKHRVFFFSSETWWLSLNLLLTSQ